MHRAKFIAIIAFAIAAPATLSATQAQASLIAPASKCAAQKNIKAPESAQQHAMRCLINYARKHSGSGHLKSTRSLERAAGRKSGDVMRCGLSHTACGEPADAYPRRYGYTSSASWQFGENLAWGRGKRGSARNVLEAWLNSPPHRETLLRGSFDDLGLGLRRGGFDGHRNSAIWVLQVGCHGC